MKKFVKSLGVYECHFEALEEHMPLEDHLPEETEESLQEMYDKINRGDLVYFCAKVSIEIDGREFGTDYLGGCIYNSYDEFLEEEGYFQDMVAQAMGEARINLVKLVNKIREWIYMPDSTMSIAIDIATDFTELICEHEGIECYEEDAGGNRIFSDQAQEIFNKKYDRYSHMIGEFEEFTKQ